MDDAAHVHSYGISMVSAQEAVSHQHLLRDIADHLDRLASDRGHSVEVDTIILTTEEGAYGKRPVATVFFAGESGMKENSHGQDLLFREHLEDGEETIQSLLNGIDVAREYVERQAPHSRGIQACCILINDTTLPDDDSAIRVSVWISE